MKASILLSFAGLCLAPTAEAQVALESFIKSSNSESADFLGGSVALSGDTLVIGAEGEDGGSSGANGDPTSNAHPESGAVYVFTFTGGSWSQTAYLRASNADAGDNFGWAVDLDGDTLVVGAPAEDSDGDPLSNAAATSGAAYVFTRTGSTWVEQGYLKAAIPGGGDRFGCSVAVDGDRVVIGADFESSAATTVNGDALDDSALFAGAAYVFSRTGTAWSQDAYLKASNAETRDYFGVSVSISGETVAVGAYFEDSASTGQAPDPSDNSAPQSGAVYVFGLSGGTWSQTDYLKRFSGTGGEFGISLDLEGNRLVIGSLTDSSPILGTGVVHVFARNAGMWSEEAVLTSSNSVFTQGFGRSVALHGDRVLVGNTTENSHAIGVNGLSDPNLMALAGAAYLFERTGTTWGQTAFLKALNPGGGDVLGSAVALSATHACVGAPGEDSSGQGVDPNEVGDSALSSGAAYTYALGVSPPAYPNLCVSDGDDGSGCGTCPCSNDQPSGSIGGCTNSSGAGARLKPSGVPSVSLPAGSVRELRFGLTRVPTGAFCVLTSGDSVAPTNAANPCFGTQSGIPSVLFDGLRCSVGTIVRHGGRAAEFFGTVGVRTPPWGGEGAPNAGIAGPAGFLAGQTRFFQAIHREDPTLVCSRGLNTSQAVGVTFEP